MIELTGRNASRDIRRGVKTKTSAVRGALLKALPDNKLTCLEIWAVAKVEHPGITRRAVSSLLSCLIVRQEAKSNSDTSTLGKTVYWIEDGKPKVVVIEPPRVAHWTLTKPFSNLNHWPHGE